MTVSKETRIALVTGGTAGIGEVTARRLAGHGLAVVIVGREPGRGEAAVERISRAAGAGQVSFLAADLSDQRDICRLSQRIGEVCPRLDVLVNNAGGLFGRRRFSPQGIEMTFALNHLGYFLLTRLLLPLLEQSSRGRIVNVASEAHRSVRLDFDNLQGERRYNRWLAYKRSKLANLLFTYELARRLEGHTVTVNAVHPGFVATDIGVRNRFVPSVIWRLASLAAISPEQGADTSDFLATSDEVAGVTGQYFIERRATRSSPASYDEDTARRLWAESERLVETDGASPTI
jgi:NAD(P)-dependent dehydrogenase (short-subunit alcohol dehydrogenase family)